MDTKFWGPDGWKFLHSCVQLYTPEKKSAYIKFFNSIKNVLPCIYCRMSFSEYITDLPIENYIDNLPKWLYLIHNKVNDKLRKQGYVHEDDPTYEEIYERYKKYTFEINKKCDCIDGLEFIYCVVFNYPENLKSFDDKMNYDRIKSYIVFLESLSEIYPIKIARNVFKEYINLMSDEEMCKILSERKLLINKIYDIEKEINKRINHNCISYDKRCELIETKRAGCKKNTCRLNP